MALGKKEKPADPTPDTPPVVLVTASPWGEVSEEEFKESTRDKFYVHGYSDRRAEYEQARLKAGKATPLNHRFQYVSVQSRDGRPVHEKAGEYKSHGYVEVRFDECAKWGIDPNQSGFVRGDDGTCRVGSQMLMVAPAKVAATLERQLDKVTREQAGAVQARMEAATNRWNQAVAGQGGERISPIFEEQVTTERETR